MLTCPICTKPRDKRYQNVSAGEACVHPCHWPYMSSDEIASASIALDRIDGHGVKVAGLLEVWGITRVNDVCSMTADGTTFHHHPIKA